MAQPNRSSVTIDGDKFDAVSVHVEFKTAKDRAGMPSMGSLETLVRVIVDFHDDQNMPHGTLKKLFELSNVVTRDKIKEIKLEYWKDESKQDALCSYSFKGWVSRFATLNPLDGQELVGLGAPSDINHLLLLEIEPVLNQQNFKEVKMSN